MGIVDAKGSDALVDPEENDPAHFLPELGPVRIAEVQRVDVLVPFGRIFGVPDRSVWADVEPVAVLRYPRMIGRRVDGKVEHDLDSA